MKKLIFTLVILTMGFSVFAQVASLKPYTKSPIPFNSNAPHASINSRSTTSELLLDYQYDDYINYGASNFGYFTFPTNVTYTQIEADSFKTGQLENYGIVSFDTMYDTYTGTSYSRNSVSSINVDTIVVGFSHKNLTKSNDTIILEMLPVAANGFPNVTGTPYATDTIVSDTSLSKSLDTSNAFLWIPNVLVNANQFAVAEYYHGPQTDTFQLWSGTPYFSATCGGSTTYNLAYESSYYPNSYVYDTYNQEILPTASGGFVYYDCNGDKKYESGIDGASYIENLWITASVRLNLTGIQAVNNNLNIKSISPNPASQLANVYLGLKNSSNITINLVDLSGRVLKSYYEGNQGAGTHQFQLDISNITSGSYIVNIIGSNGDNTFGKLVVIK